MPRKPRNKGEKYVRVGNRLRVHGYNKNGRYTIIRWEDIEDLKGYNVPKKKGKYKIVEYIFHFKPTKRQNRPSDVRNWEVRVRLPEGYSEYEAQDIASEILAELTNWDMVESSDVSKTGKDLVRYSDDGSTEWKVIDTARPQYKYPKKRSWGRYQN